MFNVVLALMAVGGCACAIIHFTLWRDDEYLSAEKQILEMMDETSIDSETLWSLFDRLN